MLSEILDMIPFQSNIEEIFRFPRDSVRRKLMPEIAGQVTDNLFDLFIQPLGAKLGKLITGMILMYGAGEGGFIPSKDADDVVEMATHLIGEVFDPSPEELLKFANDIQRIKAAFAAGKPEAIFSVLGFRPNALENAKNALSTFIKSLTGGSAAPFSNHTRTEAPPPPTSSPPPSASGRIL